MLEYCTFWKQNVETNTEKRVIDSQNLQQDFAWEWKREIEWTVKWRGNEQTWVWQNLRKGQKVWRFLEKYSLLATFRVLPVMKRFSGQEWFLHLYWKLSGKKVCRKEHNKGCHCALVTSDVGYSNSFAGTTPSKIRIFPRAEGKSWPHCCLRLISKFSFHLPNFFDNVATKTCSQAI